LLFHIFRTAAVANDNNGEVGATEIN
jgi:hypothetical protein